MLVRILSVFSLVALLAFVGHGYANNSDATININTASAAEMAEAISGVGIKKAERIVSYRESNGEFSSVSELANVKGIGVNIIEKNLALLRVDDRPDKLP